MNKKRYALETVGFGLCALFGIILSIHFVILRNYYMLLISGLFAYVAVDNFFCGTHARKCGYKVKGHYCIPPFLKRKQ